MSKKVRFAEIGILLSPDVRMSAVHGLTELFMIANRLAEPRPSQTRTVLRASHWRRSVKAPHKVGRVHDTHAEEKEGKLLALIVPPSQGAPISKEAAAPFARWMAARHDEGAILCSVCTGAFLLAETGLVNGLSVTTHWAFAQELRRRFPGLEVDADQLLIDHREVVTAGGVMAWADLGLTLVERYLGAKTMIETARFMLVDPPGREQKNYESFAPSREHGDEAIRKVQQWLDARGAKDISLRALSMRAGLQPRTFLRRFRKATGENPIEYCQKLRVENARGILEGTKVNIDAVAKRVGYEDPGAFRKVFHKVTGLSPGEYRGRFRR